MSDNMNNNINTNINNAIGSQPAPSVDTAKKPDKKPYEMPDPVEVYKKIKAGTMRLIEPFEVEDKVHEELKFDFGTLTGDEYVKAMDCDGVAKRSFSNNQCLTLFCQAAGSVNGLSPETVRENLRVVDTQEAIERALNFLLISRAVARLTSKK